MTSFSADENDTLDRIIESRRTVREFKTESPPRPMIEEVIRAGLLAPYARISVTREDFRRFVVIPKESGATARAISLIKRRSTLVLGELERRLENDPQKGRGEKYLGALRMSSQNGPPNLGKAPYYIIVAEQRGIPEVAELSLAHCLENMWLKATALGLAFQLLSVTERMTEDREFCELIGIPYGEFSLDGCLIGYPDAHPAPSQRPPLNEVTRWL